MAWRSTEDGPTSVGRSCTNSIENRRRGAKHGALLYRSIALWRVLKRFDRGHVVDCTTATTWYYLASLHLPWSMYLLVALKRFLVRLNSTANAFQQPSVHVALTRAPPSVHPSVRPQLALLGRDACMRPSEHADPTIRAVAPACGLQKGRSAVDKESSPPEGTYRYCKQENGILSDATRFRKYPC